MTRLGAFALTVFVLPACGSVSDADTDAAPGPGDSDASSQADASVAADGGSCTPATCADQGATCGSVFDGCGSFAVCGDPCTYNPLQTITPFDGVEAHQFGFAVSLAGNVLMIGGPAEDATEPDQVWIYERDGAAFSFAGAPGSQGTGIGFAVATTGTRAAFGAQYSEVNQGKVEIVELAGNGVWGVVDTLKPADITTSSRLGENVDIRGSLVIAAVPGGADAYVFERDDAGTWNEQRLSAEDGTALAAEVAAGDGVLGCGSPSFNGGQGTVVLFQKTGETWEESGRLTASDGTGGDGFGASVAFDGDRMAIGAPGHGSTGAVYIFEREGDTWTEAAKATPVGGAAGDQFGIGVALDDTTLVVGTDDRGAYIFQFHEGSWMQTLKQDPPTSISGAVSVSGGVIVIGNDRDTTETGAAHLYERAP